MTVSINGTNGLVFNDGSSQATAATGFGFKSRIINGNMAIDQRNAGAAVTATGAYPVDRWQLNNATDASLSVARSTDVPSGQGFTNSVVVTTTTADASIGAAQYANLQHRIEGFNFADMGFGASGASSITLSFWVKATVSGNYSVAIYNSAENRINPQQFSVSAGGTWEKKTITIAGDTTGTWLTNNGIGANVTFYYALGSNFLGSSGWNSGGTYGVSGQSNALASNSNTFAITGVQLEKGSTATSFDYRPYGAELVLCQRYYFKHTENRYTVSSTSNGSNVCAMVYYPVPMRATPTITTQLTNANYNANPAAANSWDLTNPGQADLTKTGTYNVLIEAPTAYSAIITWYGATLSGYPTGMNIRGLYTEASSEL